MTNLSSNTLNKPATDTSSLFHNKNCVTVFAKHIQDNHCALWDVYWRIGKHRQGVVRNNIHCDLRFSKHDAHIAAELFTMQWLLEDQHAAGKHPNPSNIVLIFSKGSPIKLAADKSTKANLYPYAHFLKTRFAGATILADANSSWIRPGIEQSIVDLPIDGPVGEYLTTPGIGPVWLTNHLMRQFRMRLNNVPYEQAWKILEQLLTRCTLERIEEMPQTAELNAVRHRTPGVRLYERTSHWNFILIEVKGRPTLVTAYIKTQSTTARCT